MTSDPVMARLREATADQYEILRELGRGGMAAVYLAYEIALDRYVAIKALIAEPEGDEGGAAARRFLQEARTAARLSHPNVVRVFAVAPEGASVRYFTMQYVDGCSLDDLLRASGRLPIPVACHILAQIVAGLRYAHGHDRGGVVHRDVKPANVMLDSDGRVVLTDFGIARIAGSDGAPRDTELFGTPEYMSPEQWREEATTPASDQYSLGAVTYRMLAGVPPFEGAPGQQGPVGASPRPLLALREDCPPRLAAVVERMLERSPDARYASLDEVYRELLPLVPLPESVTELRELVARAAHVAAHAELSPAAPVETPAGPAGGAEGTVVPVDPTVQLPPPAPPRRRRALLAMGGVAIAAGGLAALVAFGRHPRAAPARSVQSPVPTDTSAAVPAGFAPQRAEASGEAVAAGSVAGSPVARGRAREPRRAPAPPVSRRPTRVTVAGLPADGRLREGDSVRVRATVLDARGARVAAASVELTSSDSARVAVRTHGRSRYVVARAAGGAPVRITARSGRVAARRSVSVVGRAALGDGRGEPARGPSDSAARPHEGAAAVGAALDSLVAGLSANRRELLGRLRPADGDSASAIRFLEWAAGVRRLRVRAVSRERPVFARGAATVDFAVDLTWHRGLRRDPVRTARLRATFVPDGRGWRLDHLQLREPFSPR